MTAEHFAGTPLIDSIDVQQLLDELSNIYRWLLVTDSRWRVLRVSPGVSGLFGGSDLELGTDVRRFVDRLPRPEQVFSVRRELRNRRSLSSRIDLRTRDGEIEPVELHVLRVRTTVAGAPLFIAIARPLVDRNERPVGASDAMLEEAPDAILAIDAGGFVARANSAALRLTGRTRADLVGRPAALLFAGNAADLGRVARSLRSEDVEEYDAKLRRADGHTLPVSVTARLVGGSDAVAAVLCIRESSEREHTEADLLRANDELEHCITSLAHDLRSPLVALLGFSRLLRQEYGEAIGETGRHFVDRIEEAGRTIESLVHHVLELSRAGQPGERTALVDPREVLSQLRAELKPRLEEAGIELSLPEPAPPLLSCDRTRLYQLFSNLIGNAIEHMGAPAEPRIDVSVEEQEDAHLIVVRDNGRGIDPAHRDRIFEPFQSFAASGRSRGAGMGLAIVKKIVEKRGGRIWVESELGKGAAFHIRLPRR
jgi:PAS domain S-box-containing protein